MPRLEETPKNEESSTKRLLYCEVCEALFDTETHCGQPTKDIGYITSITEKEGWL